MVKESIAHGQLNTCSSAGKMPLEYVQYMADVLVLFFLIWGWCWKCSLRAYKWNCFNLAYIFWCYLFQIINWPGWERWDNLRIFISSCRFHTEASPFKLEKCRLRFVWLTFKQRGSTLPDLKTFIFKAHNWALEWHNNIWWIFAKSSMLLLCHWNSANLKPLALNCICTILSH